MRINNIISIGIFLLPFESLSIQDMRNIMLLKIKLNNYIIADNILDYILEIPNITILKAESIIHKIMAETIITKKPLSLDLLLNSIKEMNIYHTVQVANYSDIASVMKKICNHTQLSIEQIKNNKNKETIKIKYLAIYVLRKVLKFSCQEVAKYFNYKDHTTLPYACSVFEKKYKDMSEMQKRLSLIV